MGVNEAGVFCKIDRAWAVGRFALPLWLSFVGWVFVWVLGSLVLSKTWGSGCGLGLVGRRSPAVVYHFR